MQPNSNQLARRDIALASLLGIVAANGSNFGHESTFAGEFSGDFGEDFCGDFSEDFSGDFSADPVTTAAIPKPTPQQAIQAYRQQHAAVANRNKRVSLMNPNRGSDVKVERYSFTISQSLTLGTTAPIILTGQPDTSIRPQIVTMNAPAPMFATITEIKVANVSVTVGTGLEDAYNYNANAVSRMLDMPLLTPANRATVLGDYTGYVPPGFPAKLAVAFSASFKGPASITG
jgi:hypothetical protein